jgi:ADP-ribose pyrophosphatase
LGEIGPEETLESRIEFAGKLISVRVDTVRVGLGSTTVREIVIHPEVVAILPVLEDGRVVMVRQFRKAAERVLLEIPAGGIDEDETAEQAVRREMKEETGYDVDRLRLLCRFYTSPGFTTELMHLYRADDLVPGEATEETDQLEVEAISVEDARARVAAGEIVDAKTILALQFM